MTEAVQTKKDWILVVDDDEQLIDILVLVLEREGYEVRGARNGSQALQLLRAHDFSMILLDLKLADENGLDLLPRFRELNPNIPLLMITAHGDVDSAVRAFALGANGYIRKPFREGELKAQIANSVENYRMRRQVEVAQSREIEGNARNLIQSRDPAMDELFERIGMAAQVQTNVVIQGESGTGKELVARALHLCGPRRKGPFIAFNCGALPENLAEAELFGYVRGAFTDARDNKPGLFQRADGGTLFLDEIGDAPLVLQTKLLRALQEREVLPLGGTTPIKVDVRVVCATHKPLREMVDQGRFRQDLFYRLHVFPIYVSPLRTRPKDIVFLATLFAQRLAEQMSIGFEGFTPAATEAMIAHPWPGNVRELQNRVEHAIVISRGGRINAVSLFPERGAVAGDEATGAMASGVATEVAPAGASIVEEALPTFFEAKNSFERTYLERILTAARGNIAAAARLASKSRTEVYSLLRKHGLDPVHFKRAGSETANSTSDVEQG